MSRSVTDCGSQGGAGIGVHSRALRPLDHSPVPESIEVTVIRSQDAVGQIAVRIERAYRRLYPGWVPVGLTPGVWESAAARLLEGPGVARGTPVDPELYVAVQVRRRHSPDPWAELTQRRSLDRYLRALRRIVGQLRQELKSEVRRAECLLVRGVALEEVLRSEAVRISPLGRYILAYRAGRRDLSSCHRVAAARQHRSCPLYRLASRSLLPGHAYPLSDLATRRVDTDREIGAFSLN
jgi:hypothetical protein